MRVALITPDLRRSSGGLAQNVPRLASALGAEGLDVELLFVGDGEVPPLEGVRYVSCRLAYPARARRSPEMMRRLLDSRADVIHANGLWLSPLGYAATASSRLNVPLVLSPRGMLAPWSLRRSRLKKWLAARVLHPGALRKVAGWHATSISERNDLRLLGFQQPICLARNGIDPLTSTPEEVRVCYEKAAPGIAGQRVLLFYSRFHSKKGIRELLADFAHLAPDFPDWHFLAVGIPEEYSVDELRGEVESLGLATRATIVDGTDLPKPYAVADLFVLPSHHENFGQVVAEALVAGVPVVTTKGTPWKELEGVGAGRWVSLQELPATLAVLMAWPQARLEEAGRKGHDWVLGEFSWRASAVRLAQFYETLVRGSA